jgi:tetratricopeptide (TPR) repeat protein
VLFRGWNVVHDVRSYQAEEARKREKPDEAQAARKAARAAGRETWKHCPAELVADWGKYVASTYYEDSESLTPEEKGFAVEVARAASRAAPDSPDHLDMLACCLFAAGQREEAIQTLKRAIEIAPDKKQLADRLREFEG